MRYNTYMKEKHGSKLISPILVKELLDLGHYLRALRVRAKFTIADMSIRMPANPRTVSKIEKGDPTVSVGALMSYLHILGLGRNVSERILGDYMSAVSPPKPKRRTFTDEQLDF